jgi:hypothetical protein
MFFLYVFLSAFSIGHANHDSLYRADRRDLAPKGASSNGCTISAPRFEDPLHQRKRLALKASQTYAHYFGFVVKRETTVGLVAIPELLYLPFAVLIHTLLSGNDFAADPG